MAEENVFTDQNFQNEVISSEIPVLVDFWAPWCAPCRIIAPIIEELANEYAGKLKVGKLNVDENQQTAAKYNIMSIPTLLFFKGGQPVDSIVGAQSKEVIKQKIEQFLQN
ncbi:MAG: thioredoxin [Patescibacteria group bacterium]|nr:MAG: thioredoxin [Patescibacteria group bacterium]